MGLRRLWEETREEINRAGLSIGVVLGRVKGQEGGRTRKSLCW